MTVCISLEESVDHLGIMKKFAQSRRKATLIAVIDLPHQVQTADEWLEHAQDRLTYISDQKGCGCCIFMWDVEGPIDLIETIPEMMRCSSDWAPEGLAQESPRTGWLRRFLGITS